jgi:hypothetical protein
MAANLLMGVPGVVPVWMLWYFAVNWPLEALGRTVREPTENDGMLPWLLLFRPGIALSALLWRKPRERAGVQTTGEVGGDRLAIDPRTHGSGQILAQTMDSLVPGQHGPTPVRGGLGSDTLPRKDPTRQRMPRCFTGCPYPLCFSRSAAMYCLRPHWSFPGFHRPSGPILRWTPVPAPPAWLPSASRSQKSVSTLRWKPGSSSSMA